jgi:putative membrane protein
VSAPSVPSLLVSHWALSWSIALPAALTAGLYLWAGRRVRAGWPARRSVAFLTGLGVLLIALQSGLDRFDDRMLSVHMVQHMLLLLVAPAFLLGGRPVILILSALAPERRPAAARALARSRRLTAPLPVLGAFTGVVVLTHLPGFYDATLRDPAVHDLEHALYLTAGLLLLAPLLDGDPAPRHRLGGLGRLGYVMASMIPMALVGAYLNRHTGVVYAPYDPAARTLGISAVDDQAQAGAVMWVLGNTIMVAVGLWTTIAAMIAEERRQVAREARAAS